MTYEMTGTVKTVMEVVTFPSGFRKQMFVVTTPDKFPQDVQFECLKDKTALLDNVRPGDTVAVKFDIQGREYNGKYFVSLVAWGVKNESDHIVDPDPQTMPNEPSGDDDDNIHF